jgi:hypothetical protein
MRASKDRPTVSSQAVAPSRKKNSLCFISCPYLRSNICDAQRQKLRGCGAAKCSAAAEEVTSDCRRGCEQTVAPHLRPPKRVEPWRGGDLPTAWIPRLWGHRAREPVTAPCAPYRGLFRRRLTTQGSRVRGAQGFRPPPWTAPHPLQPILLGDGRPAPHRNREARRCWGAAGLRGRCAPACRAWMAVRSISRRTASRTEACRRAECAAPGPGPGRQLVVQWTEFRPTRKRVRAVLVAGAHEPTSIPARA